jgi:hypothetical protein
VGGMTEPPAAPTPIHIAIPRIIGDLPNIGKDSKMTEGPARYDYRGIEDIMPHVKQLFARHGVHVSPMYETIKDEGIILNGKPWNRVVLQGTFRFGANDGSYIVARTIGEARDNSDKAYNKAMTAAYKYAITQVLAISDGDDPDAYHPEQGAAGAAGGPDILPNYEALKALGPMLKLALLDGAVKEFARSAGIDLRPGHDEDRLPVVTAEAKRLLDQSLVDDGIVAPGDAKPSGPPPVPEPIVKPDTDIVAQARRELDEVIARGVETELAVEGDPLARIMEQFGPGTEVIEEGQREAAHEDGAS